MRVGFAGLGLMGSRMSRRFLEKGFPLTVWNRTAARARPLEAQGARVAPTPRALAEASDVVMVCLADPPAVERFVFGEQGLLEGVRPGFRYIETSTLSPGLVRRIAGALREKGAECLEAPVTGSKVGAEKGTLVIMTGGPRALHDELMPVLMAVGAKAIYCGETGQASVVKLIGNTIISFMLQGLCEGIVVGQKAGLTIDTLLEVVMASGYASPYFPFKAGAIARGDYDTHFSLDLLVKDQGLMLDEAGRLGAPMPGLATIREACQAARAQGFGGEDIAALYKAVAKAAGLPG
jgi:3-hydroxyisobutyrate dehydrogenase-like beta-hydroxyacid dehydrogenase